MRSHDVVASVVLVLAGTVAQGAGPKAVFTPLGFLTEDPSQSIAYAVSGDGAVVVGESLSPIGFEAFRWTPGGGMEGLGAFKTSGFLSSQAYGISADGSVVVGVSLRDDSLDENGSPCRWVAGGAPDYLGNVGGDSSGGAASAASPGGAIIVGFASAPEGRRAFRWSPQGGMAGLAMLQGQQLSNALDLTDDGSLIVGYVSLNSTSFPRACRWLNGAAGLLSSLNSGAISAANAVTPNGETIVGNSAGLAVRWTGAGIQSLGLLPNDIGTSSYHAHAVTTDGSVIVGLGNFSASQGTGEAFIWDKDHGMRGLNQVLVTEFGVNLGGFWLYDARGISADGSVIVGYGFNGQGYQEGFRVEFIASCAADFDGDGFVTGIDYDLYVGAFERGDVSADFDGDGFVTGIDFDLYVAAFEAGCG